MDYIAMHFHCGGCVIHLQLIGVGYVKLFPCVVIQSVIVTFVARYSRGLLGQASARPLRGRGARRGGGVLPLELRRLQSAA
jgi:hypothetical protein